LALHVHTQAVASFASFLTFSHPEMEDSHLHHWRAVLTRGAKQSRCNRRPILTQPNPGWAHPQDGGHRYRTRRPPGGERGDGERRREPTERRPFAGETGHFLPRARHDLLDPQSWLVSLAATPYRGVWTPVASERHQQGLNADRCRRVQTNSPPGSHMYQTYG
jgi:hypothetical protein